MFLKRVVLLLVGSLFCCGLVYAGDLTALEAMNYFNVGVKAQNAEDYEAANTAYQKVMLLVPSELKWKKFIVNNYGIMFVKQGNLEQAEANFKEVLAMDPDYIPAQLNLGMIYDKRKTRLESLEYWVKLYNLESRKPKSYIMEGEQVEEKKK